MADYKAKIIESMFEGMQLMINNNEVWTPFIGRFNAQNLIGSIWYSNGVRRRPQDEILIALSQVGIQLTDDFRPFARQME